MALVMEAIQPTVSALHGHRAAGRPASRPRLRRAPARAAARRAPPRRRPRRRQKLNHSTPSMLSITVLLPWFPCLGASGERIGVQKPKTRIRCSLLFSEEYHFSGSVHALRRSALASGPSCAPPAYSAGGRPSRCAARSRPAAGRRGAPRRPGRHVAAEGSKGVCSSATPPSQRAEAPGGTRYAAGALQVDGEKRPHEGPA